VNKKSKMTDKIKQYLKEIEQRKDIKILFACETGSRAWGFPSPDSDFDIRLIYVHKKDWYLTLSSPKDNIDLMFENNDIDISGWELKKSLSLLRKSNASMLERIQSPIIYDADVDFLDDILKASQIQYSRIATIHHYLSMAKRFMDDLQNGETFKLKKFFYALRSAMICKWILEKDEMPPIEFRKIYPNLGIMPHLVQRIEELIALKSTVNETYLHSGEAELLDFIQSCIREAEEKRQLLPGSKATTEELNVILRKYITKYDH
jgi:predicted nucleotidyltransferase